MSSELNNVVRPSHYLRGGIETIEVIRAKLGPQGFGFYCEGNVLKYLTRWRDKNGIEDLRKAQVYLDWLLTEAGLQQARPAHEPPQTDMTLPGPPIDPPEIPEPLARDADDDMGLLHGCANGH